MTLQQSIIIPIPKTIQGLMIFSSQHLLISSCLHLFFYSPSTTLSFLFFFMVATFK